MTGHDDVFGEDLARQALADPRVTSVDLQHIAAAFPQLRAEVAAHPAAEPALLGWLDQLGSPEVSATIRNRGGAAPASAASGPAQSTEIGAELGGARFAPPDAPTQAGPGFIAPGSAPQERPSFGPAGTGPQGSPAFGSTDWSKESEVPAHSGPIPFGQLPGAAPSGTAAGQFASVGQIASGPANGPFAAGTDASSPNQAFNWAEPAPVSPKRRRFGPRALGIAITASVLVIALVVTGFLTRGFGLLAFGGADTPEAEAIKVVDKAVDLFNNWSVRDGLKDPLEMPTSFLPLFAEVAPSELLVLASPELGTSSSESRIDFQELLAVNDESIDLATEIIHSFHLSTADLRVAAKLVSADIAAADFTGGTIKVEVDAAKLRSALERVEVTATAQVAATAAKYGVDPMPTKFEAGWIDSTMQQVEQQFPLTVELAKSDVQVNYDDPLYWVGSYVRDLADRLVLVREDGRWYLSPVLTAFGDYADVPDRQVVVPEAADNKTPVEGAEALAAALNAGKSAEVAANLALADRRLLAFGGYLEDGAEASGIPSPELQVSEIASTADHVKLRVDKYDPTPWGGSIEDGTCWRDEYDSRNCLGDWLSPDYLAQWASYLVAYGMWDLYEAGDPWQEPKLQPKLEAMQKAIIEKFDVDQVGIVMVQEDGSWHASSVATIADLRNQIAAALIAGLVAAQG